MTDRKTEDDVLEELFKPARGGIAPDDAFLTKLMDIAEDGASQHIQLSKKPSREKPKFHWTRWLPASGLTAATLAGFWIGMVLPASDIGLTYLSEIGTADSEIGAFVPTFGVEELLEIDG